MKVFIKAFCFCLMAIIWVTDAESQNDDYIDSLINEVSKSKADTNKLHLLSIIAENAGDDIWPMYNNEMGKLAARLQKSTDPKIKLAAKRYLAGALNNKGYYFTERGANRKAMLFFNKSLAIQREIGDLAGQAYSLSNLGTIYDSFGEINKALEYYFEAVKIREGLKDKLSLAQSYNNIAVLYNGQNDFRNALTYHHKSLAMRKILGDPAGLGLAYNNIGTTYTHFVETSFKDKGKVPDSLMNRSLEYFTKGYENYQKSGYAHGIGLSLYNMADYYVLEADCYFNVGSREHDSLLVKAEGLYKQCFDLFAPLHEKEWKVNTLNGLANIYLRQKKIPLAKSYAEQGLAVSQELGFPGAIQNSADILRQVYKATNDVANALKMTELYFAMRDSVVNEENQKEALSKYFMYESEKQHVLAKANQEKMEIAFQSKTKQQNMIIWFVIACLILASVFGVFIYKRFKITKKQNAIIQIQKQEVERQKVLVEESRKEIVDSINYAKRIQYALLAHEELLKRNLNAHFVLFKPKDIVSGDFYWATNHGDKFYLAVCDSTGHGVPGAFMSLLNIGFMSEAIKEKNIVAPNEVFNYVRKRLIESITKEEQKDGMDGTLICFNKSSNAITYASAHNSPLLISNGEALVLPCDKMPVGKGERMEDFQLFSVEVKPTDQLYIYTDGYADQFGGPKGKKFKNKTLKDLLTSNASLDLNRQSQLLNQEFEAWKGNLEQVDDVCVIGIKF